MLFLSVLATGSLVVALLLGAAGRSPTRFAVYNERLERRKPVVCCVCRRYMSMRKRICMYSSIVMLVMMVDLRKILYG